MPVLSTGPRRNEDSIGLADKSMNKSMDKDVDKSMNKSNHSRSKSRVHSQYLERMSDYKSNKKSFIEDEQDQENHSPKTGKSTRKMYFDVKKELDVARIEHLMKEVSPASQLEQ